MQTYDSDNCAGDDYVVCPWGNEDGACTDNLPLDLTGCNTGYIDFATGNNYVKVDSNRDLASLGCNNDDFTV